MLAQNAESTKGGIGFNKMSAKDPRHEARRIALATLFERSFHSVNEQESIKLTESVYQEGEKLESQVEQKLLHSILEGVAEKTEELNQIVSETAPAWPPDQITKIDLVILRIAIFELVFAKNVPPKVAIDEAVELAKEFGGASSGSFVNGVLGTVVEKYLEGEKKETE